MALELIRKGPRLTFWVDINIEWLRPAFKLRRGVATGDSVGYIHFGFVSIGFGTGKGRDVMWDTFDRGQAQTK